MTPTEKQIEEIADELDCGMVCYFHLKTGEIKTLPDFDNNFYADEEPWEEYIKEIDDNRDDYFQFEGMRSYDSFKIMADFTDSLEDSKLQEKLINALNRRKPFQNFKWHIDNSGEYRQQWFDFKRRRYIEWVKEQMDDKNADLNE